MLISLSGIFCINLMLKKQQRLHLNSHPHESQANPTKFDSLIFEIKKIYYDTGNYDLAIEKYRELLADKRLNKLLRARIYHQIAKSYRAKGEFANAISNYKVAIKHNPKGYESFCGLGAVYRLKNKSDLFEAERAIKKALELRKGCTAFDQLGLIYRDKGEYHQALKWHRYAWNIERNAITAFYMALLHFKLSNKIRMRYYFFRAVRMAATSIRRKERIHWMYHILGIYNLLNKNFDKGLKKFKLGCNHNKSSLVKKAMTGHLEFISDIIIEKIGMEKYQSIVKLFQ
ncbi:hypothetical protein GF337_02925 [candidate division KSB1 bacterium]|nr:hypothetical protein [candidate division KSB1 bacterium]